MFLFSNIYFYEFRFNKKIAITRENNKWLFAFVCTFASAMNPFVIMIKRHQWFRFGKYAILCNWTRNIWVASRQCIILWACDCQTLYAKMKKGKCFELGHPYSVLTQKSICHSTREKKSQTIPKPTCHTIVHCMRSWQRPDPCTSHFTLLSQRTNFIHRQMWGGALTWTEHIAAIPCTYMRPLWAVFYLVPIVWME